MKSPMAAAALFLLAMAAQGADDLTAQQIVQRVHEASGGQAWLKAGTRTMRGDVDLCRDGNPAKCIHADRCVMYRVYPTELAHGAHAGSGRVRLDASAGEKAIFQAAFDGTHSYDQDGPRPRSARRSRTRRSFGGPGPSDRRLHRHHPRISGCRACLGLV
jgi:opacity protein-like surface antigen